MHKFKKVKHKAKMKAKQKKKMAKGNIAKGLL